MCKKINIDNSKAYRNIPAKVRQDLNLVEHLYSMLKVDKRNDAKHSASFIRKYGKCMTPIKAQNTKYQTISLYRFYKANNKVLKNRPQNNHYQFYMHRVMYSIKNITKTLNNNNLQVNHKCSNTQCCNPNHLELISTYDNQREKVTRIIDKLKIDSSDTRNELYDLFNVGAINNGAGGMNDFDFESGEYTPIYDLDDWNGEC
ncbi:hypothetical protein [Pseudoalteromonas sp. BSi20495]|uniref:hypothetical protein n=1 Tax=Pseudoalteromonas sp. BSi20495 TaxID=386429 RepID=UPI00023159B6|nr:hypothetical protein [Pseudoalteromonas sp. BSi20495]GAA78181.1 hypothetical protein P20495_0672 [Pseudoalteromonas sp. BSi20495]